MSNIVTNFDTLSLHYKFLFIMSSSEIYIISVVLPYADTCLDIRDFMTVINQHVPNVPYWSIMSRVWGVGRQSGTRSDAVEHNV